MQTKMPQTIYLLLTLATVLLAGCTADEGQSSSAVESAAITFGARVEGLATRAGQTGVMDYSVLSTTGFGVYAYGPMEADYTTALTPNLFCNEKVERTSTTNPSDIHLSTDLWTYVKSGVTEKDWPKAADAAQKLTFFAYAPYVSSSDIAADATNGITAVSGAGTGDPTVSYQVATTPGAGVDLLWGVNDATGLPWKDKTRDEVRGPVLFTFRHALAAVAFHVQAIVDKENNLTDMGDVSNTGVLGTDCKVTLKSIALAPTSGSFYAAGTLNLNNTTAGVANWTEKSGSVPSLVLESNIDEALLDQGDKAPASMTNTGVTETANTQTVIAKAGGNEQYFMLIPDEAKDYTATVEYYVTYKTSESTYKRLDYTGANAGTATFSNLELKSGVKYYLNLVIGLTTFSMNVTATDWADNPIDLTSTVERGTSASESLVKERKQ